MPASTAVSVGAIDLKSPLICGSGEHLMYAQGIRHALAAGAAAVVSKSTNESEAARRQLAARTMFCSTANGGACLGISRHRQTPASCVVPALRSSHSTNG